MSGLATLYERAARPVLFRIGGGDAERAHEWTLHRLAWLGRRPLARTAVQRTLAVRSRPVDVFGIRFPNPVGLAAGMDKNGVALDAWPALGFGFVEVGTVTWRPQPGNEQPRLFRLVHSQALVNRMGFDNAGALALANRLAARTAPLPIPLGISLGKSRATDLSESVDDYLASLRALYPYGDFFAINVSSPNTPDLRRLQDRDRLDELLRALRREATALHGSMAGRPEPRRDQGQSAGAGSSAGSGTGNKASAGRPKPLLVKIAPDLTDTAIAEVLDTCIAHGVAGIIATNTTLSRTGLHPADVARGNQSGGLSGRPLAARAREVVSFVHRETGGRLPVIGVGGILTPDDALRMFDAGASLIQIYTGLIYHGPALIRDTVRALAARTPAGPPAKNGKPKNGKPKDGKPKDGKPKDGKPKNGKQ